LSEEVEIVGSGVGEVNESDVLLAQATEAVIYAFNTKISSSAKKLSELEKVKIITYNIIYKLFEDLEKKVLKILEPTIDEEVVGEAKIDQEFTVRGEKIAGCKVKTGEINKNSPIHLKREEEIIADTKIKSLKRGKEDIESAKAKSECGIAFKPKIDFRIGDMIISYRKIDED
jgi:translation initiation factor IF-2